MAGYTRYYLSKCVLDNFKKFPSFPFKRYKMKKLLLTTAIATALFAVNVSATVVPLTAGQVDFSSTTGIANSANVQGTAYFAGSSAATPFLENTLLREAGEGTIVYRYADGVKDAITYVFNTGSSVIPGSSLAANSTYVVHKRDAGGSVKGVLSATGGTNLDSVTYNTTNPATTGSLGQIAAASCAPATTPLLAINGSATKLVKCTASTTIVQAAAPSDNAPVNLADVDGPQFASPLNGATTANLLATSAATVPADPLATQVFGVALTLKLRNALQVAGVAAGNLPADCLVEAQKEIKAVPAVKAVTAVTGVTAVTAVKGVVQVGTYGAPGYVAPVTAVAAVKGVLAVAGVTAVAAVKAVPYLAHREAESCMANLTSPQLSSIFAGGRFHNWANLTFQKKGGTAKAPTWTASNLVSEQTTANQPGNTAVHLCSRTAGSGTLAMANILFQNAPCSSVNDAIQAGSAQDTATAAVGQTGLGAIASTTQNIEGSNGQLKAYHSNKSGGDLISCLTSLDGANASNTTLPAMATVGNFLLPTMSGTADFRWAVGILNVDQNPTNVAPYRFAKIDGYSPSSVNVASGKYKFWTEVSVVGALPTIANPLAFSIFNEIQNPSTVALSNVYNLNFGVAGYMGISTKVANTVAIAPGTLIGAAFDAARPVNPFTHADNVGGTGTINHCRAAAVSGSSSNTVMSMPGLN